MADQIEEGYLLDSGTLDSEVGSLQRAFSKSDADVVAFSRAQVTSMVSSFSSRFVAATPDEALQRYRLLVAIKREQVSIVHVYPAKGLVDANGSETVWFRTQLSRLASECSKYKVRIVSHFTQDSWDKHAH